MNGSLIVTPVLRTRLLAGLCAALFASSGGARPAAAAPAAPAAAAAPAAPVATSASAPATPAGCACTAGLYSVINLDPEGGAAALLNEKGQAAFGSFVFGTNGFFDGERVLPIGSLGGGFTVIKGLNERGLVVGESVDASAPFGTFYPFTWTRTRGMRALPASAGGQAWAVNDHDQVAGSVPAPATGTSARAARWDPNGAVTALGPLPFSLSEARALNNSALAGGYADAADGSIHATLWDAGGRLFDLGTLGGPRAFTLFVNERGEAAGVADLPDAAGGGETGFFWSRRSGMLALGNQGGGARLVAGLNARGEVVGISGSADGVRAFQWSRGRGLVPLPRAGAPESDVFDINNRSDMVGRLIRSDGARAVLWRGLSAPIDLNRRLARIPAGLVLEGAAAINEAGVMLAYSNAGLVMLRPGTRGTDAPVLGPLTELPEIVSVGQRVRATLGFIDNAPTQTHRALADWGDRCASPHPLVSEAAGSGTVLLEHVFCTPGFQTLVLQVHDSGGRSTETRRQILVNAPGLAALSGRGTLAGAGAALRPAPLRFTLWAPLGQQAAGAASGQLLLQGPFSFRSDSVAAASLGGGLVRVEGSGRYNGRAGYRFILDARDGAPAAGGDRMRVRISHRDSAGLMVDDYDSAAARIAAGAAGSAGASAVASPQLSTAGSAMAAVQGVLALSQ